MPTHHLTSSEQPHQPQRCTRSRSEREKAWRICSLLLTIGRPATPQELASRCPFVDATARIVLSLCSIPNSSIRLTEKRLVTVSTAAAASALVEFVAEPQRDGELDKLRKFRKRKGEVGDHEAASMPKRRLLLPIENGEGDGRLVSSPNASNHGLLEGNSNSKRALVPLLLHSDAESSSFRMTPLEHGEGGPDIQLSSLMRKERPGSVDTRNILNSLLKPETCSSTMKPVQIDRGEVCLPDLNLLPSSSNHDHKSCQEALAGNGRLENDMDAVAICLEEDKESKMDAKIHDTHSCTDSTDHLRKDAQILVENNAEEGFIELGPEGEAENLVRPEKLGAYREALTYCLDSRIYGNITLEKDQNMEKTETKPNPLLAECPSPQKQISNLSGKLKGLCKNLPSRQRVLMKSYNEVVNTPKQENHCKSDLKFSSIEPNLKNSKKNNMHAKENMVDTTSISPKLEKIQLPQFDNYIIEEEEGSGGYGTVYRAQRKTDGKKFAIKCPHVKAHKHHVDNERKMLERFGGRNFIIKYEGSFRSGGSECFILEHVEQDRPELLRKEIDLYELQWYGYCMFRALACLHKQGVVHRDVKPGNFLFSRKLNKGYLIDFNLATDLQRKYTIGSKSKSNHHVSFGHVPLPQSKSAPLNREKKLAIGDLVDINLLATKDSKQTHDSHKDARKRVNAGPLKNYPDSGCRNIFKSQCADGSVLASKKDVTSTKTPSTERTMEPLPCVGRKELINLVQDAICKPDHDPTKTPASQRKRVAATPCKIDRNIIYTSPMSLHFTGVAASDTMLLKTKGDGRQKREGPCVGTKGFRAPEVLFRSLHQGPKVDVWSAGVTLLYMIIGRTPFTGEPEQNIKDLVTLKGSEDLWEVAKLHDRESAFPAESLDIKFLPSMELQSWCKAHTKRSQFLRLIPRSLFDLVDKCLIVNPRLRISAEEALRHEFFAPCHESLRKQRMLRPVNMSTQNDLAREEIK